AESLSDSFCKREFSRLIKYTDLESGFKRLFDRNPRQFKKVLSGLDREIKQLSGSSALKSFEGRLRDIERIVIQYGGVITDTELAEELGIKTSSFWAWVRREKVNLDDYVIIRVKKIFFERDDFQEKQHRYIKDEVVSKYYVFKLIPIYLGLLNLSIRHKVLSEKLKKQSLSQQEDDELGWIEEGLNKAKERLKAFNVDEPDYPLVLTGKKNYRLKSEGHLKAATRMLDKNNRPAAIAALAASLFTLGKEVNILNRYKRENKPALRFWRNKQGEYKLRHGVFSNYEIENELIPMLFYNPKTFRLRWQACQAIDHMIDFELDEIGYLNEYLRLIERIRGKIERAKYFQKKLSAKTHRQFREEIKTAALEFNPRWIMEKMSAKYALLISARLMDIGLGKNADAFLGLAKIFLENRRHESFRIVEGLEEGVQKETREYIKGQNEDISRKIENIYKYRNKKLALGLSRRRDIKNEPEFEGMSVLFGWLANELGKDKKVDSGKVDIAVRRLRRRMSGVYLRSDFRVDFRKEYKNARLKNKPAEYRYDVFSQVYQQFAKKNNFVRGSPYLRIRFFQAAMPLTLKVKDPLNSKQRIDNPAFKLTSKCALIQEIRWLGFRRMPGLSKKEYPQTRGILEKLFIEDAPYLYIVGKSQRKRIFDCLVEDIYRNDSEKILLAEQRCLLERALAGFLSPDLSDYAEIDSKVLERIREKAAETHNLLNRRTFQNIFRAQEIIENIKGSFFSHLKQPVGSDTIAGKINSVLSCLKERKKEVFLAQNQLRRLIKQINDILSVREKAEKPYKSSSSPSKTAVVIDPAARAAIRLSNTKKVAVAATTLTIKSSSFSVALKKLDNGVKVFPIALPDEVVIAIESGNLEDLSTKETLCQLLEIYLSGLKLKKVDALILGCSHYTYIKHLFNQILGKDITIIDAAGEQVKFLEKALDESFAVGSSPTVGQEKLQSLNMTEVNSKDSAIFSQQQKRFHHSSSPVATERIDPCLVLFLEDWRDFMLLLRKRLAGIGYRREEVIARVSDDINNRISVLVEEGTDRDDTSNVWDYPESDYPHSLPRAEIVKPGQIIYAFELDVSLKAEMFWRNQAKRVGYRDNYTYIEERKATDGILCYNPAGLMRVAEMEWWFMKPPKESLLAVFIHNRNLDEKTKSLLLQGTASVSSAAVKPVLSDSSMNNRIIKKIEGLVKGYPVSNIVGIIIHGSRVNETAEMGSDFDYGVIKRKGKFTYDLADEDIDLHRQLIKCLAPIFIDQQLKPLILGNNNFFEEFVRMYFFPNRIFPDIYVPWLDKSSPFIERYIIITKNEPLVRIISERIEDVKEAIANSVQNELEGILGSPRVQLYLSSSPVREREETTVLIKELNSLGCDRIKVDFRRQQLRRPERLFTQLLNRVTDLAEAKATVDSLRRFGMKECFAEHWAQQRHAKQVAFKEITPEELLPIKEIAEALGVSKNTLNIKVRRQDSYGIHLTLYSSDRKYLAYLCLGSTNILETTLYPYEMVREEKGEEISPKLVQDSLWNRDSQSCLESDIERESRSVRFILTRKLLYNLNWFASINGFCLEQSLRKRGIGRNWYNKVEYFLLQCGFRIIAVIGGCAELEGIRAFYKKFEFSDYTTIRELGSGLDENPFYDFMSIKVPFSPYTRVKLKTETTSRDIEPDNSSSSPVDNIDKSKIENIEEMITKEGWQRIDAGEEAVAFKGVVNNIKIKDKSVSLRNPLFVCKRVQYSKDIALYRNMVLILLDEYFRKKGKYSISHIPYPLGWFDKGYFYIYAEGGENFSWEFRTPDRIEIISLEEWNTCVGLFNTAGIGIRHDVADVEDSSEKNVILEEYDSNKVYETFCLPKEWKRIDFGTRSLMVTIDKLKEYIK
ncbi:MAG: aspartate/glutamate racemase family protein, partial [Candidatus Omnitrophica bacterium]|nr:aspartate/glutamate racemase family protein [Candidatus Omnitrophota bacterium]